MNLRTELIAEQSDRMQALAQAILHLPDHRRQLRGLLAGQRCHVPAVQARARIVIAGVAIVEQRKTIGCGRKKGGQGSFGQAACGKPLL